MLAALVLRHARTTATAAVMNPTAPATILSTARATRTRFSTDAAANGATEEAVDDMPVDGDSVDEVAEEVPGRMAGKVCMVVGAGSGLGRRTAKLLAENGAEAVVVVDTAEKGGLSTVKDIRKAGGRAAFCQADVSVPDDAARMAKFAVDTYGRLNVMVNNGQIAHKYQEKVMSVRDGAWERIINTNLRGVFLGCKYSIPMLRASGGGSVVNIAPFTRDARVVPHVAFNVSRGGVLHLTRQLAVTYAPERIRFNTVVPGALWNDDAADENEINAKIPMGRGATRNEVAQGIMWLASDESSYVTGVDIAIDGGLSAAGVMPTPSTEAE